MPHYILTPLTRRFGFFLLAFALLVSFAPNAQALLLFEGTLQTTDGITGTGDWATDFKISWSIAEQANNTWQYTYALATASLPTTAIATSHMTLEISTEATENDFSEFNGNPIEFGIVDDSGQPGSVNAVKLDYEDSTYTFISAKAPVWGDFYVKGGRASGQGPANLRPFNTAWNTDFLMSDPTDPPQGGLLPDSANGFHYKILRPDSTGGGNHPSVPEPATFMLISIGLASARLFCNRKGF